MKKVIIILCALAVIAIGVMRLTPTNIELEVGQLPPSTPAPIVEAIAEPEEITPLEIETAFVEPVCPEGTEVIATPEPEPIVIEEVTPRPVQQPLEQSESGIRTADGQQQLYVPGFGWMEYNGDQSICIVVTSDGDINKMVGSMD